jgi:hypothetical protein
MNLNDILNRRSDLSTFLIHLTRAGDQPSKQNLEAILRGGSIGARNVYGHLSKYTDKLADGGKSQRSVCFTESPLEYTYILASDIDDRSFCFEPYGIAIPKKLGRKKGINPVWYLDITPGHTWLTQPLDRLRDKYIQGGCQDKDIASIFPYIEQMGSGPTGAGGYRKEFWWEREWRHVGDFALPSHLICLCPEAEIDHFSSIMAETSRKGGCIDPTWSLERIIAQLAGFPKQEIEI